MQYMLIFKPDKEPEPGIQPCRQHLPEMAALMSDLKKSGVLIATQGLLTGESGARVKLSDGKLSVIDGPFAEAKELVAGVALVEVKSKSQAVELATRFLAIAGGGVSDILQVMDSPGVGSDAHQ